MLTWEGVRHPGFDFLIFRQAGNAVVHGRSPYVTPTLAVLSQQDHFVYPQPFAYLFAPFTPFSAAVGAAVFLLASLACIPLALRLLGVTDWRLYGLSLVTAPALDAAGLGAVSAILLLVVAAAWRTRGSAWSGVLLAVAAGMKLFLWPLLLWLIVTRRFRACVAAAATLAFVLAVWAFADPAGLREYPRMLRLLEEGHPTSYSLRALWIAAGFPASSVVPAAVAVVGGALIWRLRDRDARCYAAGAMVALLATPIMWLHYLVLLFVPLALLAPTLSWPWLLPMVLWVTPTSGAAEAWRSAVALSCVALVWVATVRPPVKSPAFPGAATEA